MSARRQKPSFTPARVQEELQRIQSYATKGEPDWATRDEQMLWERVLQAIAEGDATDPQVCARLALRTRTISFTRTKPFSFTGQQVAADDDEEHV